MGLLMFDSATVQQVHIAGGSERINTPSASARSLTKRLLDLVVAASLLLILLPALIVIGVLLSLESKGPVMFKQRRGGLLGRPFVVFKFRTMRVLEDGDTVQQASKKDSRVTAFGALLRRTSMDELPQLINVLRGEMSLVGPRPHALAHDKEFQERCPAYAQRFTMRPGITGLAQIRGFRGDTSCIENLEARVSADLEYAETWTLWTDIKLLVATLKVPLDSRAY